MTDSSCLVKIVSQVQPTEVYNLAAQSHVMVRRVFTLVFIINFYYSSSSCCFTIFKKCYCFALIG